MERVIGKILTQVGLTRKLLRHNKETFRNVGHIARIVNIQPAKHSICEQCGGSKFFTGHSDVIKHFKASSRQISAMASVLLRSPAFNDAVKTQVEQLRHFNSSGMKSDQEKGRDGKASRSNEEEQSSEEDEESKKSEFKRLMFTTIAIVIISLMFANVDDKPRSHIKFISWNEFYHNMLIKGEVKSVRIKMSTDDSEENLAVIDLYDGAVIKGMESSGHFQYVVKIPDGFNFEEKVRQLEDEMGMSLNDRISINYSYSNKPWVTMLFFMAIGTLGFIYLTMSKKFSKSKDGNMTDVIDMLSGGIRQAKFTRVDIASRGVKAISFKDVAGLKEAKVEIMEFVDYLTNPQRYKKLGAKTPRGALLLGPPGCGKTLLARAVATEAKVPFLAMAGSEFVEMIGGVGAARVRSLFKEARARAPCIIYIDEIDAIGRSRGGSASVGGEDEHTLNQLLVEMDGIGTIEDVIMIAATNRADILDKALLRPGRFDRHIMIDLPTLEEREEIFKVYLDKLKLAQSVSVYAKPLSKLTPGMSGADINNICNEAAIHAARVSHKVVDTKDFEYAVERVIAGVEKKTNQLSPHEKKVVAYHESGHALVGWMLKHTDALIRISIIPRTNSALGFTQYLPADQHLYTQEELFERMCMALGGRAAENLIFNHVSSGAHDDLQRVTDMAYNQVRSYGMNARIGHLSFPSEKEQPGQRPYSQMLAKIMDEEARSMVAKAFLHTQAVIQENKDKLIKLASTLLEKEALSYEDIEALIGAPPHGKKNTIEQQGWQGMTEESQDEGRKKTSSRRKQK